MISEHSGTRPRIQPKEWGRQGASSCGVNILVEETMNNSELVINDDGMIWTVEWDGALGQPRDR